MKAINSKTAFIGYYVKVGDYTHLSVLGYESLGMGLATTIQPLWLMEAYLYQFPDRRFLHIPLNAALQSHYVDFPLSADNASSYESYSVVRQVFRRIYLDGTSNYG